MRLRKLKPVALGAVAMGFGMLATTSVPMRTAVFVKEFERSGRGPVQVSVWERVVYSLIEANDQSVTRCAPSKT
jgi:hypothetical protein